MFNNCSNPLRWCCIYSRKNKMKKVLVTGCCGFIGSHLCDELVKEFYVIGVDNLSLGSLKNIEHLKKNFEFHEVDILGKEFRTIFQSYKFEAVFHLAANSDISKGDPERDFKDTLSSTLVVLENCRMKGIKDFIFTSSGAIYGESKKILKEDDGPLFPISHYGAAKLSSEAFISAYSSMYDIQAWICRLPNVIGPRMTHGCIYDFKNRLKINPKLLTVKGDGTQTKPYMYVKDTVDAILFIWRNAPDMLNYYNLAGIGQTSVKEIAEIVAGDTDIVYQGGDRGWKGDIPTYNCETSKLGLLGWVPRRTSTAAVKLTMKKL